MNYKLPPQHTIGKRGAYCNTPANLLKTLAAIDGKSAPTVAGQLFVHASTVRYRLIKLESIVGVKLFNRASRRSGKASLTDAGRAVLDANRELLQ